MNLEKLHILLAEDDQDDRLFFKDAFDNLKMNHTLKLLENGFELMAYLHDSDVLPHIVFLDLNMPGKSGMECLNEIKNNERLKNLTVAIYSSLSTDVNVEEAFIAGANVFIKKPNDFNTLKKILKETIYINWQYLTDDLNKENFMLSY